MAESGLQPWMQWRLLQPIEANLVEGDLERWGQWWQGSRGQAFWQSCEWLWQTFGWKGYTALLLCVDAVVNGDDLPLWVLQWQAGNGTALMQVAARLWQQVSAEVSAFASRKWPQQDWANVVHEAFWWAFERMDLKVSNGEILTDPTGGTKEVKLQNGTVIRKKVFKGKQSERDDLTESTLLAWRGARSFVALFKRMWRLSCYDVLRHTTPHQTILEDEYDQLTGKLKPVKRRVPVQHISMDSSPEDDREGQGGVYEPPSDKPSGEPLVLDGDRLCAFVDALAQVAKQLDFAGKPNLAAVPEQLILYVKRKVAETNLASLGFNKTRLRDQQFLTELLSVVQDRDIEDLLDLTNAQHIEFDGEEVWDFVQSTLSLKRDALYKRRQRFFDTLSALPEVPEILHAVVALLWLKDMKNWDKDCHETAERLRQHGDENKAHLLHLIACSLRWTFAQAYHLYRQRPLDWVLNAPPEELFKANNPALLAPSYPNSEDFRRFVTRFFPEQHGLLVELPSLQEAIDKLGEPRPIRLVKLIKALLHKKDSDDKEPTEE